MVKSIGAEKVIDYTHEDFTQRDEKYDVIFDAVRKIKATGCKGSLKEGGCFLSARSPTKELTEYLESLTSFIKKIEVCNRTIKSDFQAEAQAAGIQTIEELNASFWAWAELVYNKRINSTTGEAPDDRFLKGLQALFLVRDSRTVSKYGQIKVFRNKYPVTKSPIKTVVGIRYNPHNLSEIHIYDQKQNIYLETTTPSGQVQLQALRIPEENKKSSQTVSKESIKYFARLRKVYLEQQQKNTSVDFSTFYPFNQEEQQ